MRLPAPIILSKTEIMHLKALPVKKLNWLEDGDNGQVIYLKCLLPSNLQRVEKSIQVSIQPIKDLFYQIHINIAQGVQKLGLSTKIYESLVLWLGHVYSGKKRRQNSIIDHIWDKLDNICNNCSYMSHMECYENSIANICISKKNPQKSILLQAFLELEENKK